MQFITDELELIYNSGIVAVYFYSQVMPLNHKKMISMIDKVSLKNKNIKFYAVDIDYHRTMIKRFGLQSVPTTIIFNNGKEIDKVVGACLTQPFEKVFKDINNKYGDLNEKS